MTPLCKNKWRCSDQLMKERMDQDKTRRNKESKHGILKTFPTSWARTQMLQAKTKKSWNTIGSRLIRLNQPRANQETTNRCSLKKGK